MSASEKEWRDLQDVSQAVKAAADPTRLRLLKLCAQSDLTVSALTRILGHSQPRVSRHLKVLVDSGLLERHPEGAWVFYRLADEGGGADLARSIVHRLPEDDSLLTLDNNSLNEIRQQRARQAAAYFDSVAGQWDDMRQLHGAEDLVEQAIVDNILKKNVKILLDVGTGTGRLLSVCAPHVERGIGIDTSREMLQVARANLDKDGVRNCTIRYGDMYRVPLETGTVDGVIVHQVLHYADNPKAVIMEVRRVLSAHGRIIIADLAPHDQEHFRDIHQHRRLGFSNDEVHQWFHEVGLSQFSVREITGSHLTVRIWSGSRS